MRFISGKIGCEVVEEILYVNGIYDVDVVKGEGFLIDYYDLNKKVVCLFFVNYDRLLVVGIVIVVYEVGYVI